MSKKAKLRQCIAGLYVDGKSMFLTFYDGEELAGVTTYDPSAYNRIGTDIQNWVINGILPSSTTEK